MADKRIPAEKLQRAMTEIRDFLLRDGGNIRVVEYNGKTLTIQFLGNCMHCSIKDVTLNTGIKAIVRKYLPEVETVKEIKPYDQ